MMVRDKEEVATYVEEFMKKLQTQQKNGFELYWIACGDTDFLYQGVVDSMKKWMKSGSITPTGKVMVDISEKLADILVRVRTYVVSVNFISHFIIRWRTARVGVLVLLSASRARFTVS